MKYSENGVVTSLGQGIKQVSGFQTLHWSVTASIKSALDQNNTAQLSYYHNKYDLNTVLIANLPVLQYTMVNGKPKTFDSLVALGLDIEIKDPGTLSSPLNYAASIGANHYVHKLIDLGADVNSQDKFGSTPLNAACYYMQYQTASILLDNPHVDVNQPDIVDFFPPIYWIFTDGEISLENKLFNHPTYDPTYNAIALFDYFLPSVFFGSKAYPFPQEMQWIYDIKYFAHKFDVGGLIHFKSYEKYNTNSFYLEGLLNDESYFECYLSFEQFYNAVMFNPALLPYDLIALSDAFHALGNIYLGLDPMSNFEMTHYLYNSYMAGNIVILPAGWEAHAVSFVLDGNTIYRCNRGMESDGIHGIDEFTMQHPEYITEMLMHDMYGYEGDPIFIQDELVDYLGLTFIHQVENPTQTVGNCAWTSAETSVEAAFIASYLHQGLDFESAHIFAKDLFHAWEEYDLSMTLYHFIENQSPYIQEGIYGHLLISALDAHHDINNPGDIYRGTAILTQLSEPSVLDAFNATVVPAVLTYDPDSYSHISYMSNYPVSTTDYYFNLAYSFGNYLFNYKSYVHDQDYFNFLLACDQYQQSLSDPLNLKDILHLNDSDILSDWVHSPAPMNSSPIIDTPIVIETHFDPLAATLDPALNVQVVC